MDENRLSGTARNPHGQTQQAEESVQELYGQAKEAAGEAIHAVGKEFRCCPTTSGKRPHSSEFHATKAV